MNEDIVKRNGKVAFMDVSETSEPSYSRMTKFTSLSKSKNAKEYSRTYVDEDGEITDVTGYAEEISYKFDLYKNNPVHQKIVNITDNELVGEEALAKILVIDFSAEATEGAYPARLRTYAIVPSSEGDDENAYTYSGTFKKHTSYTKGTATISADGKTATFTAENE